MLAARSELAGRIAEYQPLIIVSLLRSIRVDVEEAMKMADCCVDTSTHRSPAGADMKSPSRTECGRAGRPCLDSERETEMKMWINGERFVAEDAVGWCKPCTGAPCSIKTRPCPYT